jgi:hypothetical protein
MGYFGYQCTVHRWIVIILIIDGQNWAVHVPKHKILVSSKDWGLPFPYQPLIIVR